jgi:hypothetical protein
MWARFVWFTPTPRVFSKLLRATGVRVFVFRSRARSARGPCWARGPAFAAGETPRRGPPPPHGGRGGESGGSGLSRSARRRSEVRHEWMNWERSIMSRDNSLASWVRGWTVKPRCSLSVSKQTGTAPCAIQSGRRGSAFESSACIVQKHVMYGTGRCLWSARRGSLARAWLIFF